ncbi:MAG: rhaB [Chthoniobacteraceae bacterium]|nr:rhaB [Chthoniobacteraceae bacterium]
MPVYIAIDLGAESGRVMLATLEHGRLELDEIHRFTNGPLRLRGTLRWDVARLWEEIKVGLRKVALRNLPIASLSVDSWALDYVLLRRHEPLLRLPYNYRDARTDQTYGEARQRATNERIFNQTGVQFMPINTLYHLLADLKTDPGLLESADHFLLIGDWFHFLFSGRIAQEQSNASTTQLFNPLSREWSEELIGFFGLPRHIFPPVVPSCSRLGPLLDEVAEETGLGTGVEVVAGCTHDTGAAVAAVPAEEGARWAYLSSGTWSLIGVELAEPLINQAACHANFTNEIGCGGSIRFLKNIAGLWILQECRRAWSNQGNEISYEMLTQMAAAAVPLRSLVNPNDPRFLRPGGMVEKVQAFCRESAQPIPETPGEIARCVFESLALLYGQVLETIERLTSAPIEVLHIVGGGSKNALLNQFAANATGRQVLAGPVEATAIGNALLQAITLGHLESLTALRKVVRDSFSISAFTPADSAHWQAARQRFELLST